MPKSFDSLKTESCMNRHGNTKWHVWREGEVGKRDRQIMCECVHGVGVRCEMGSAKGRH